jgi:hypothetical protein
MELCCLLSYSIKHKRKKNAIRLDDFLITKKKTSVRKCMIYECEMSFLFSSMCLLKLCPCYIDEKRIGRFHNELLSLIIAFYS